MDEDYDEYEPHVHTAACSRGMRWSWTRLLAVGVQAASNMLGEVEEALDFTASLIMQHSVYKDGQHEMAEQAAYEIEQLTEGEFYVIDQDELDDELHEVIDEGE